MISANTGHCFSRQLETLYSPLIYSLLLLLLINLALTRFGVLLQLGYFGNQSVLDLAIILTVKTGGSFDIFATINAASLTVTAGGSFTNSEITVDSFTVTTGANWGNDHTINTASFTVTTGANWSNSQTINAASFTVTSRGSNWNNAGTINTDNFHSYYGKER